MLPLADLHRVTPAEPAVARPSDVGVGMPSRNEVPVRKVDRGHAVALNMFYRRRSALDVAFVDRSLRIAASWAPGSDAGAPDMIRVDLRIDGEQGELILPGSIVDRLIASAVSSDSWRQLGAAQAAIVLELILSSSLEAIEAHTGTRIALMSLHADNGRPRSPGLLCVSFALQSAELGAWRSELALPAGPAMRLAGLIGKHTRAEPADVDISLPACLRVAAATLNMREVRGLAAGDVVLVDDRCTPNTAILVIAEHLAAEAEVLPEGGRLVAAPMRARGSKWEWAMGHVGERTGQGNGSEASYDDIPIRMTFEFGQVELSFGELRELAPGVLVPLSRPLEDGVDIVVNGRRLGRGTLVSIGDSFGVQVTRLFGHD